MRVIVALDLDYFYAQVHEVELRQEEDHEKKKINTHVPNTTESTVASTSPIYNASILPTSANKSHISSINGDGIVCKANKARPIGVKQKHIIVTANYSARAHGVTKLQLLSDAMICCPELVVIDGSDLTRYREKSEAVETTVKSLLKQLVSESMTEGKGDGPLRGELPGNLGASITATSLSNDQKLDAMEKENQQVVVDRKAKTTPDGKRKQAQKGQGWREEQRAQLKKALYMTRGCINAKYKNIDTMSGTQKGKREGKLNVKKYASVKTPVQKSGMDEWFCDVTGLVNNIMQTPTHVLYTQACALQDGDINVVLGEARQVSLHLRVGLCVAKEIQAAVLRHTDLTCSVGVSTSKLGTKIAVNHQKPHGSSVFVPEKARAYMADKCVKIIPGCGSRYTNKIRVHLYSLGFRHGDEDEQELISDPEYEGSGSDSEGDGDDDYGDDGHAQNHDCVPPTSDTSPENTYAHDSNDSGRKVKPNATERQRKRQLDRVISTKKSSLPKCFQVLDAFLKPEAYAGVLNSDIDGNIHERGAPSRALPENPEPSVDGGGDTHLVAKLSGIKPISMTVEDSLSASMSTKDVIASLDFVQMAAVMHAKYDVAKTIALKCLGTCLDPVKESGLCTVISAEDSMQKNTFTTKLEVRAKMLTLVDNLLRRVWRDIAMNKRLPSTLYVRFRNSGLDEGNKANNTYQSRQTPLPYSDFGSLQRMLKIAEIVSATGDKNTDTAAQDESPVQAGSDISPTPHISVPAATDTTLNDIDEKGLRVGISRKKKENEENDLRKQCEHLRFVVLREAMSLMMRFSLNTYEPDTLTLLGVGVTGFSEPRNTTEVSMDAYLVEDVDNAKGPAEARCPICGHSFIGMLNSDMHGHLDKCIGMGGSGQARDEGCAKSAIDGNGRGRNSAKGDSTDGVKRKINTLFDFSANTNGKKHGAHSGGPNRGKRKRGK
ncbi:hypothetical protein SARC_02583 [Sphaeroforma arctica JP610]|uniref:UmuC domain-containing protein n=1 Tax=Sphaeroforma arctica JP610 TaxID=667725 RepID=A0A0L0G874_9EUKA|nr:hypothetical protein SARC_02583 [Sphaeroforma arctica JP610]KNC85205.1 hypothetical protein SARC_02583 [Sphaeroforma arctica JP610]|eukprot:XP_014159107.1 hypothetical protein SARC_02583 [Sphaeroforma arctica JP610]